MLLNQAMLLRSDLQQEHKRLIECGCADPVNLLKLPKIDANYVSRWRRAFGVTWRTVNLRYKISHAKRKHRLCIFWSNVMRLRLFHEALFGINKLRFVGYDQKPFYFNTSIPSRTFSIRGCTKVAVKECVAASRERFTVMTHCQPWPSPQPPPLAILFKAQSSVRIRTKLQAPANTLLQFAEKGSY